MEKLIKAVVVATATTVAAAIILHQLDKRAGAGSNEAKDAPSTGSEPIGAEIDADQIEPAQRQAMLAELEAQL